MTKIKDQEIKRLNSDNIRLLEKVGRLIIKVEQLKIVHSKEIEKAKAEGYEQAYKDVETN